MVRTLKLGAAWHPCDDAAGHEHAPSRAEVPVVPRAHRRLSLHRANHVLGGGAADFGRGFGAFPFENSMFIRYKAQNCSRLDLIYDSLIASSKYPMGTVKDVIKMHLSRR